MLVLFYESKSKNLYSTYINVYFLILILTGQTHNLRKGKTKISGSDRSALFDRISHVLRWRLEGSVEQSSRDEPEGVNIADTRKHHVHTRDTGMDTQTSLHPPPRILSVCRVNKALADHSAVPLFPPCDPHEPSDLIPSQLPHQSAPDIIIHISRHLSRHPSATQTTMGSIHLLLCVREAPAPQPNRDINYHL